jgi:signal transduction histidine kinase/ligand-binding sensor domain-containing protein/ActR/RegA family two-component response regulator
MRLATAICIVVVTVLLVAPAWAQRYHVRVYNEGDGLPSSTVSSVVQGPDDRMWFATRAGVAVYDASEWITFAVAEGLDPPDRQHLAFDDSGSLWAVGDDGAAVSRFRDGRWDAVEPPARSARCSLREVVGTESGIALGGSCGLRVFDGADGWRRVAGQDGTELDVLALARLGDELWIGTRDGLLTGRGAESGVAALVRRETGGVFGLAPDRCGPREEPCLWIVGSGHVWRMRGGRWEQDGDFDTPVVGGEPLRLAADGRGGLYLGDAGELLQYRPGRPPLRLDERNGLASGGTFDVTVDREGLLWAASGRGVSKLVSLRFATLSKEHGLYEDEVTAVLQRRDGTIVLAHRTGLTLLEEGGPRLLEVPEASFRTDDRLLELAEQADGTLWVAGNALGLGRLEADGIGWLRGGPSDRVSSVMVDAEERLWVAERHRVLRGVWPDLVEVFAVRRGRGVRRLVADPGGGAWVLTDGDGVYRIAGDSVAQWSSSTVPGLDNAFSILPRPGGAWVGTGHGLAELDGNELRRVRLPGPAIERPVYFIVADRDDRVWFGTDNGVMRWNGETLEHFTVDDGLGGRETNRAAGMVDGEGNLWIGTTGGVTVYRPDFDYGPPSPPSVELVGVNVGGATLSALAERSLAPQLDDLEFSFRAISFYDERNIRLHTWLEGFDTGWSDPRVSSSRRIRFTNLPPGEYRFHVRAANRLGPWSPIASSATIRIRAPFWRRTWFWAAALLLAAGLGVAAQRYVDRGRRARTLEAEVRQRVAELRRTEAELVKAQRLEALGLLAGGIAHDFNNLLMAILGHLSLLEEQVAPGPRRWVEAGKKAVERARQLTVQLLTFSRGGAPVRDAARIDEVLHESVSFALRGTNVRAEIELDDELDAVDIDAGQISQVMNNLLINAAQSMPEGGVIRVAAGNAAEPPGMLPAGRYVCVEVADRGRGIAEQDLPHIFDPYFSTKEGGTGLGLATAYSIVRRHDGLLTVESVLGEGTRFRMYLPASEDQAQSSRPPSPVQRFDGIRVLVMDDDAAVREATAAMLRSLGCVAVTAQEGGAALQAYAEASAQGDPFAVVILDLTVPGGMGGVETLGDLRRIDPGVVAIVASGYSTASTLSEHRRHGFAAVLRKPYDRSGLAEVLTQVLDPAVAGRAPETG